MRKIFLFLLFLCTFHNVYSYDKTYAVIIGVADYKYYGRSDGDLKYTINDAMKFYSFLMSEKGGSVPKENIVLLLNEEATKENIIKKSKELFANVKEKDRIFFFFSGHGLNRRFMPYDVTRTGDNVLYFSEVAEIFRHAKCNTKLLIADACFSGTMKKWIEEGRRDRNVDEEEQKKLAAAQNKINIAIITSCTENEKSIELNTIEQGIFTYYLIKGLEGEANQDDNEYITLKELIEFVNKKVKAKAAECKGKQTPGIMGKFDSRLIVAKVNLEEMRQKKLEEERKLAEKERNNFNNTVVIAIYVVVTIIVVLLIILIKRKNKRKYENL